MDTLSVKEGFYTERDISFGASASTRIFGMFTFRKGSPVKAIRHEIRPQIGFSYKPNINKTHFQLLQVDSVGNRQRVSVYEGNFVSPFGYGKSGSINFAIDNNISMKVRNRKDTSEEGVKKVSLIDGFNLSGNYNLLLDSFKMSNLTLSARSNLFQKISITGSAIFDPYQLNGAGKRIDKLVWSKKPFSLGRMTSATISLQSSFRGGEKQAKQKADEQQQNLGLVNPDGSPVNDYEAEAAYVRNNPSEFVDFNIPWDVSMGYSFRYSKTPLLTGGFIKSINQDVNVNSSLNLTPKWKLGANGSYNITAKEIGVVSMYLSRDMHCWQMSINVSPVGRWRYFSINIAPKSPILRDLKVNRTRSFVDL